MSGPGAVSAFDIVGLLSGSSSAGGATGALGSSAAWAAVLSGKIDEKGRRTVQRHTASINLNVTGRLPGTPGMAGIAGVDPHSAGGGCLVLAIEPND
jgi:hypothetical protein